MSAISKPRVQPQFILSLGILAASTSSIFIRFAQLEAPSTIIAAYRLGIAALILWLIVLIRRYPLHKEISRYEIKEVLLSGFLLAIHFTTWIASLEFTSIVSSVVLVSLAPLFVALLSPLFVKDRISTGILLGLGTALVGAVLVAAGDTCSFSNGIQCPQLAEMFQGKALLGDFLALMGALSGAGYILIGRRLRPRVSLLTYITLTYSTAALFLILFAGMNGDSFSGYQENTYLWFLLLALIPQLVAHTAYNWSLKYLSATLVSLSLLGEPVGTSILAFFIFRENPTGIGLLGALLLLTGISIASFFPGTRAINTDTLKNIS